MTYQKSMHKAATSYRNLCINPTESAGSEEIQCLGFWRHGVPTDLQDLCIDYGLLSKMLLHTFWTAFCIDLRQQWQGLAEPWHDMANTAQIDLFKLYNIKAYAQIMDNNYVQDVNRPAMLYIYYLIATIYSMLMCRSHDHIP